MAAYNRETIFDDERSTIEFYFFYEWVRQYGVRPPYIEYRGAPLVRVAVGEERVIARPNVDLGQQIDTFFLLPTWSGGGPSRIQGRRVDGGHAAGPRKAPYRAQGILSMTIYCPDGEGSLDNKKRNARERITRYQGKIRSLFRHKILPTKQVIVGLPHPRPEPRDVGLWVEPTSSPVDNCLLRFDRTISTIPIREDRGYLTSTLLIPFEAERREV